MSVRLAVAGKGGSGKTTVAGLVIRALIERARGAVLAVDADPNASLGLWLGLPVERTLADIREEAGRAGSGGLSKAAAVEYALQTSVQEGPGVDLVTMGRPEGPGCYCYVNNLLRGFLEKLNRAYAWVVVDNEAGMEHLSRRTTDNVDLLAIVLEPTVIGILTARRLAELSQRLPIRVGRRVYVVNRVPSGGVDGRARAALADAGIEPDLWVPADEAIGACSTAGQTVFDLPGHSPALAAVREAMTLWEPAEGIGSASAGGRSAVGHSP